jgi:hypothetical protein
MSGKQDIWRMTGTKILKQEKLRPKLTSSIDNVTVNSEINACIYYCDFMKTVQNVILLNAIVIYLVAKGYKLMSKC